MMIQLKPFAFILVFAVCGKAALCDASPATQAMLVIALIGQTSLLDLEDEEEEPVEMKDTKTSDEVSKADKDSSSGIALPPPLVQSGLDQLGDLPGAKSDEMKLESEKVLDFVLQTKSGNARPHQIKLLRHMVPKPPKRGTQIEVMRIGDGGKAYKFKIPAEEIKFVKYYEEIMLERVADELKQPVSEVKKFRELIDLSHPVQLKRAQRAIALLTIALAEHDSARERLIREGDEWNDLRYPLAQALIHLQLSRIKLLFTNGQIQQATAACDLILQEHDLGPGPRKWILSFFEDMLLKPGLVSLEQGDYAEAAEALDAFRERYPKEPSGTASQIRKLLISAAESLVEKAKSNKDPKLLEQASMIWPQLAGLESLRKQIIEDYPILHCAYSSLPESFSPLNSRSPVERHASALLFESLVHWRENSEAGAHYVSHLATSRPKPLARGREFQLPRAHWSDSDPSNPNLCTMEDVRWTVRLMKQVHPFGFSSAWGGLLKDVSPANRIVPDPFRVAVYLETDHWQPLSLMDFPVLPKTSFPTCGDNKDELIAFAKSPVGTGPFFLQDAGGYGEPTRFVANPNYRKSAQPYVREIQFHETDSIEARDGFRKGDIHLIYDVRPAHVSELTKQRNKIIKLPARGIYFLAPNHRTSLKNADLRLAIAHAIDRDEILDNYFRPGGATRDHAALNGPFPKSSWAFNSQVPDFAKANVKSHLTKAEQALGSIPTLRLLYPVRDQGDTETKQACSLIQKQLAAAGIKIQLQDAKPNDFIRRVVEQQGFDLAYWRHDFKDETYWLGPLFDPADTGKGGANFMGYVPDKQLTDLFSRVLAHKMFRTIQSTTHEIHKSLSREAVVIPLWELDTYVAVSDALENVEFSATTLFGNIDSWKIRAK
jgi:ABC-type transport system substrate-binding protein